MSALAGTISAPFAVRGGGVAIARWLRSALALLVAAGILAVSLPVALGSQAGGVGADPLRVFSSGSLLAVEAQGAAQLSVDGMVPGESRSATVRIVSDGAAAGLSLSSRVADRVGPGGAPLSEVLRLRLESFAGAVLYDGPVGQMPRLDLSAAGAERAYRFVATLPAAAGNEVAGSSLSVGFAWNAA